MEVIPLDDRVRSTTVLNTAAPSDFTTVYHDNYEIDADVLAEDDLAADAAANEGMWTRRNKLLLSLIAGSALLCAIATGSGVAAHRARVANLNSCPAGMVPNVGATGPDKPTPGPTKSSKSPSTKSSKSPTAKSSKSTPTDPTERMLTGATVPATVEEEGFVGGAYYPSVPKTVEDKRKNRMLVEHLGQRDASSTLSWKLKNLGEMMPNFLGSDEEKQQQRLNYERRLEDSPEGGGPTSGPTKSSKSPSTKSSKSPTAKSSKSSDGGGNSMPLTDGLKPSTDNCKCVNSGLNTSSSNGNGGGSGAKSSKSPTSKTGKSTRVTVPPPKIPSRPRPPPSPTKSSKSPSTKSSKSPTAKSSKASSPDGGYGITSPLAPTACNAPVAPLVPVPNPVAPGGKSSKSPTSKTGKSMATPQPDGPTIVEPTPVNPPAVVKPPAPETKRPTATPETKPPTPCMVDCPGVPVVDPTPPTPGGGGGDKTPSPTRGGEGENPSVPEPTPPTPGTEELTPTPPVPTPSTPGTPDGGPTPSTPTPNCDNDGDWESAAGDSCDDVADGDANVLCVTASSVDGTSASEACPAACNPECFPPTIDVPVTFPTGFPKLDSYVPTPEITVGVTVTVGEEDKTPPTPTPSRVVGVNTPRPTNIGTSIGSSVGSSGGTITVSTETTGPPTLAIREDEQGDDEEVR